MTYEGANGSSGEHYQADRALDALRLAEMAVRKCLDEHDSERIWLAAGLMSLAWQSLDGWVRNGVVPTNWSGQRDRD